MKRAHNNVLSHSRAIRGDLDSLKSSSAPGKSPATPAALGSLSASLTAFSRTIDEYKQKVTDEPVATKKAEAEERLKGFSAELVDYRQQLSALRAQRDEAQHASNRAELFGQRSYATDTPENPYANAGGGRGGDFAAPADHVPTNRYGSGGAFGGGQMTMGSNDYTRETHALREQNFFSNTNQALDDYIARGQQVLGDLGTQRDMLKNTQKRLYSVANTLGVSGDTIRMIERRAMQDKWIFWAGAVVFFTFCWLCLHFLR